MPDTGCEVIQKREHRDPGVFQGWTQKLSIPGLVVLQNVIDLGTGIQMGAIDVLAISALAAGVAVAVALTMRARAAVIALAAVMLAMTLGAKVYSWDPYVGFWYDAANGIPAAPVRSLRESDPRIPAALDLSDGSTAYYELGAGVPEVRNNYEFRIAPARLDTIDGACDITGPGYLITAPGGLGRWADPPTVIAHDDVPGLVLVRVPGPPDGCS